MAWLDGDSDGLVLMSIVLMVSISRTAAGLFESFRKSTRFGARRIGGTKSVVCVAAAVAAPPVLVLVGPKLNPGCSKYGFADEYAFMDGCGGGQSSIICRIDCALRDSKRVNSFRAESTEISGSFRRATASTSRDRHGTSLTSNGPHGKSDVVGRDAFRMAELLFQYSQRFVFAEVAQHRDRRLSCFKKGFTS